MLSHNNMIFIMSTILFLNSEILYKTFHLTKIHEKFWKFITEILLKKKKIRGEKYQL